MTKIYVIEDEVFEYPDTGDINYGEEATEWAGEVTKVLGEIRGPGDITTTEVNLLGTDTGTHIEGLVTNLKFDTAFVQSIDVKGFITVTYSDATPDKVEQFNIYGAYNGTEINFSTEFSGDDTDLEFGVTGGQFTFKYLKNAAIDTVKIKYSATAKVDETFFE